MEASNKESEGITSVREALDEKTNAHFSDEVCTSLPNVK
jgi:hypothetical protein